MGRFYAELFVLVLLAFVVGAAAAAVVLRVMVKAAVASVDDPGQGDRPVGPQGGAA
jgi:hypothetical protein